MANPIIEFTCERRESNGEPTDDFYLRGMDSHRGGFVLCGDTLRELFSISEDQLYLRVQVFTEHVKDSLGVLIERVDLEEFCWSTDDMDEAGNFYQEMNFMFAYLFGINNTWLTTHWVIEPITWGQFIHSKPLLLDVNVTKEFGKPDCNREENAGTAG